MSKPQHKSRTIWLAWLVIVLSNLQGMVFNLPISPMLQALIGTLFGLGLWWLRRDTRDAIE